MRRMLESGWGDRLILAATIALACVWVAPLFWIFMLSFKPNVALLARTDVLFSPPFTLKNYTDILGTSQVGAAPNLSLFVGGAATTLEVLVGAYTALARGGVARLAQLTAGATG